MRYFGFGRKPGQLQSFGFESVKQTTANFVTGVYSKDGSVVSFAEVFNFSRNSTASLIKPTGLQSYDINEPRLNAGLLIERESTNLLANSASKDIVINSYPVSTRNFDSVLFTTPAPVFATVPADGFKTIRPSSTAFKAGFDYTFTYIIKTETLVNITGMITATGSPINIGFNTANPSQNINSSAIKNLKIEPLSGGWQIISFTVAVIADETSYGLQIYSSSANTAFALDFIQVEQSSFRTTPIITKGGSKVRFADVLGVKQAALTSVTGDWDSTLSLSVVNGKLVHSGYGYIRSLILQ